VGLPGKHDPQVVGPEPRDTECHAPERRRGVNRLGVASDMISAGAAGLVFTGIGASLTLAVSPSCS
jgi:hypothetical protein